MALTVTISAALLMGAGVFLLCRYAGTADMARRGVRHIRFLPRVIQPRAGYRERHDQPVPAALAGDTEEERDRQCRDQ